MRLIPILLLLSFSSFSQTLRERVVDLVGDRYTEESPKEKGQTANLMYGFLQADEAGLDRALKHIDMKFAAGVDLYVGQDEDSIMEEILMDINASFRSEAINKISVSYVSVEVLGGWKLIVIYSYR